MSVKVSIIIPVYNAEKHLEKCLDSAVSQTIAEKEILCINDGSTDRSGQIIEKYQKQYSNIKLYFQENKGPGEAKNVGLENAIGEYVSFLDADDFYLDAEALEKMVYACEKNDVQVCAGLRKIYQENAFIDFFLYRECFENGKNPDGKRLCYEEHQEDYYYQNYIFPMGVIREHQIRFPSYRRYEDPLFFVNIMLQVNNYIVLPVEFYGYRYSKETFLRKGLYIKDTLKGIRDNLKIAVKCGMDKLKELFIDRIIREYSTWILEKSDIEILELLDEIQNMVFSENPREENGQAFSLEVIRAMVAIHVKYCGLGVYFEEKGIDHVAVYGLGTFGKLSVMSLKKSKTLVLYGADQQVQSLEGVETGSLAEINKKCSHIIVTPVRGHKELVNDIKSVWVGKTWSLYELLHHIESQKGL